MGKVMINNTSGKEAVERASLAFVVAKTAYQQRARSDCLIDN